MADNDLKQSVLRVIQERNRRENEKEFKAWLDGLVALPGDFELKLMGNLKADVELQPLRWIEFGVDLMESGKEIAHVELSDGLQGPPLSSYLPYPVFCIGTEIFLKGMWLCQFRECRMLADGCMWIERVGVDTPPGYRSSVMI